MRSRRDPRCLPGGFGRHAWWLAAFGAVVAGCAGENAGEGDPSAPVDVPGTMRDAGPGAGDDDLPGMSDDDDPPGMSDDDDVAAPEDDDVGPAAGGAGAMDPGGPAIVDDCISDREFLATEAWPKVFGTICFACHGPGGDADVKNADFELLPAAYPGFLDVNLRNVDRMVRTKEDGISLLLQRPLGVDHEGGQLIFEGTEQYDILTEMVERLDSGEDACAEDAVVAVFDDVQLLDPVATFRKAALQLNGRLPNSEEVQALTEGGEDSLPSLVRQLFQEDAFYARLVEVFNDQWLTDRYVRDGNGVLNDNDFPRVDAYYDGLSSEDQLKARRSVAQEPLQLMAYIVRNDRPFTEILTADYTVLNPFTAVVYNSPGLQFDNPYDEFEFKQGRIKIVRDEGTIDWPHAGILSSPMFLNRYPTSRTNRNRHRARIVLREFLATDILKVAERPIDPTEAVNFANPTREDPNCNTCHAVIDPIAGAFMKWNDNDMELHEPGRDWYPEMPLPGFGTESMTTSEYDQALSWLGERIAADPRFPLSVVINVYKSLTGSEPQAFPDDPNPETFLSWQAQDQTLRAIAEAFVASNYNLKVAIERIVLSPYYRAKNTTASDPTRLAELGNVGTGQLLTPELLDRKIQAIFGYKWMSGSTPALRGNYAILYGGIDSETVTERLSTPNGLMGAIMLRMANEMSCRGVSADLALRRADRRLFPHVELDTFPENDLGAIDEEGDRNVRRNLRHLHALFLGEELADDSPELERLHGLFLDTWHEGRNKRLRDEVSEELPSDCRYRVDPFTGAEVSANQLNDDPNYTVRAWMAVVTYLLADYRFLYE